MIKDNYKFNASGAREAQKDIGLKAAAGGGFIGSNPYNYSVSSADGSRESEIRLHAYKMSVIKKPSSKKKELKRHINAMASMSSADGAAGVWDTVSTVVKSAITPATEQPEEEKTILGMTPVLFYSILGIIALTIIVILVKRKK